MKPVGARPAWPYPAPGLHRPRCPGALGRRGAALRRRQSGCGRCGVDRRHRRDRLRLEIAASGTHRRCHARPRPDPSGPRADQHRQDPSGDRADAGPRLRHDRPAAAAAGARDLRSRRRRGRRARRRADHRRGEDRPAEAPRYCVCTVEAMPLDREVEFLAVDEIQLVRRSRARPRLHRPAAARARPRRDHVARRRHDARRCSQRLLPGAEIVPRPRLSTADLCRPRSKLTRLPPRIGRRRVLRRGGLRHRRADPPPARRRRGGDGRALARAPATPRSRSIQSGEVDFLVATDAIGMGLNMDVDHVAFASLRKFDGRAVARSARRRDRARSPAAPAAYRATARSA